jgi:glyoxylase-like metal-dependent hydrolase (beta-lactamase superfamily II)
MRHTAMSLKIIRYVFIYLLLAISVLSSTSSHAQEPELITLTPKQISSSVWYVEGSTALGSVQNKNFISNAAFVVSAQGVVVIDALGSPALAEALIRAISKITPKKINAVIVTHYHADHIYGLQAFQKIGAKIISHPAAKEYLNSETARQRLFASRAELAPWVDENTKLLEADTWISSETKLNIAGVDMLIKPVGPAHTPEDLVVFIPEDKVLFTGDLLFRGRLPFIGPTADTGAWIQALGSFLDFKATVAISGHGSVSENADADIKFLHDYLSYLRKMMRKAVDELELFDEAYEAIDWQQFEHVPMFKFANRMNAYNTYLQLLDAKK